MKNRKIYQVKYVVSGSVVERYTYEKINLLDMRVKIKTVKIKTVKRVKKIEPLAWDVQENL